jgi:hypothetical protein
VLASAIGLGDEFTHAGDDEFAGFRRAGRDVDPLGALKYLSYATQSPIKAK